MASWKEQALIEAPVKEVWALLENPSRFAEWNQDTIEVTGVPTKIEKGTTFTHTGKAPLGSQSTTTFVIEEFEDLHEIKLRCQRSGFYSHWFLTEAQGQTYTQVELGIERAPGLDGLVTGAMHTKRYLRRAAETTLDSLRRAVSPGGTQK